MSSSSSSDLSSDRTDATAATVNVHDMPSLGFDQPVPAGGYRWWYVDAISDDGAHALTLIAFIGSVFSPYYARARARARGVAPAEDYCTVNLALYHAPARWCMTERGRRSLHTTPTSLRIGASGLQLRRTAPEHGNGIEPGHELVIDVDEISTPVPRRLQGRLTVTLPPYEYPPIFLDAQKRHVWQPIAPRTRITVEMKNPALSWRGDAYVDGNRGSVSLESSFRSWEWSRCHPDGGGTVIQYDVIDNDDRHEEKTFRFDAPTDDQPASEQADNADNPGKSDEAGKAAVAPMADRQAPKLRHLQLPRSYPLVSHPPYRTHRWDRTGHRYANAGGYSVLFAQPISNLDARSALRGHARKPAAEAVRSSHHPAVAVVPHATPRGPLAGRSRYGRYDCAFIETHRRAPRRVPT